MKKIFFLLTASLSLLAGASPLTIDEKGVICVDGLRFYFAHRDGKWLYSDQERNMTSTSVRGKAAGGEQVTFQGEMPLRAGGSLHLSESAVFESDRKITFRAKLSSAQAVATNMLTFDVTLRPISYPFDYFYLDDQKITWPRKYRETHIVHSRTARELRIPTSNGEVSIRGELLLFAQDNRFNPKNDSRDIRIACSPWRGDLNRSELAVTVEFRPVQSQTLNLAPFCNMGFADPVADDGRGGWTDQGPANDLSRLPVGEQKIKGIDFRILDPAGNNGKSCIVFDGAGKKFGMSGVKIPVSGQFRYLHLLHSAAWATSKMQQSVADIVVEYENGEIQKLPVVCGRDVADWWKPIDHPNAKVGLVLQNGAAYTGIFVSSFPLNEKNKVKSIALQPVGSVVWGIIGGTLSSRAVDSTEDHSTYITAGNEWLPLKFERDIAEDSVMDSSALLDAPAGKYGFAQVRNGKMVFEKRPDIPVRFYGINLLRGCINMDRAWAECLADRLARTGYNLVRFHVYEDDLTAPPPAHSTELDPGRMDRFNYMIHCLKQRGIYISFDFYTYRTIRPGEVPNVPAGSYFPAQIFLRSSALENWEKFTRNLLNYPNPYTGLALKDDPVVISSSYINEDDILSLYRHAEGDYRREFARWLKEEKSRGNNIENHQAGFIRFLLHRYTVTTGRMRKVLDDIGVKYMISDLTVSTEVLLTLLRNKHDFVNLHAYYDHPQVANAANMSTLPAGFRNVSGLDQPEKMEAPAASFPLRILGKPKGCTEWNFAMPNFHHAEGGALFGAYAALQDWDMIVRFCYSNGARGVQEDSVGTGRIYFDLVMNPLMNLSEKIGVAFFLERHVKPAELTFAFPISERYADGIDKIETYPEKARLLGFIGKTGSIVLDRNGRETSAVHPRPVAGFTLDPNVKTGPATFRLKAESDPVAELLECGLLDPSLADPSKGRYRSATGELEIDASKGSFRAVTPRSECLILREGETLSGRRIQVRNKKSKAVVFIASTDGRELPKSRRMLLLHLTDSRYSMMKLSNNVMWKLEEYGNLPYLLKRGSVELTIRGDLSGYKLYAVSTGGRRLGEIKFKQEKDRGVFQLDNATPYGAIAAYELVKE